MTCPSWQKRNDRRFRNWFKKDLTNMTDEERLATMQDALATAIKAMNAEEGLRQAQCAEKVGWLTRELGEMQKKLGATSEPKENVIPRIIAALEPYPEARAAVVKALEPQ